MKKKEVKITLFNDDCLVVLKNLKTRSVDALVTDPPAGISFMGKTWDDNKGGRDHWISWMTSVMKECRRVLKPGAHGLVWALPRTSHWTATALENSGFEVRDIITHLFGSGFPKSLDISKAIDKSFGAERKVVGENQNKRKAHKKGGIHQGYNDNGGASRFFYCAKVSTSERNNGLENMESKDWKSQGFRDNDSTHLSPRAGAGRTRSNQNSHPTVKAQRLMQYLIKLVTPTGGVVLDPFMGSGSTGVAAKKLGFDFIGMEKEKEYFEIAERRIERAKKGFRKRRKQVSSQQPILKMSELFGDV